MKNILLILILVPFLCTGQEQYYRGFMPSSTTGQVAFSVSFGYMFGR